MASLVLAGDTSGSITVSAPAVAGSNTQTLVATTGTLAPIVSGTAVTASGTSVDFTSIPSWVKRITVMFSGVSTSGTSPVIIQLGDSGGIETSGYVGGSGDRGGEATSSLGLVVIRLPAAASAYSGVVTWQMLNSASFSWSATGVISINASGQPNSTGGAKSLSDTLDRIRITTVNGTDTFDAGTINILYE